MDNWPVVILLSIVGIIECWYWFWWLPRHWRESRPATDLVESVKTLYGKDGVVWDEMKNGRL